MDSKDILLIIALVSIVLIVGIMQVANAMNQATVTNAMSQAAVSNAISQAKSNASTNCLKGLQNAAAKINCVQGDYDVLGYAVYLQMSGDKNAAKDYCKNAPTTGCQGLCTAALECAY